MEKFTRAFTRRIADGKTPNMEVCRYESRCSGCPQINLDPEAQRQSLTSATERAFRELFPEFRGSAGWLELGSWRSRDRVDLILETDEKGSRLGLFELGARSILDLEACPQMSQALEAWFLDFRKNLPTIRKGSLRLRVSPQGQRGLWLDFANQDVKTLLDEGRWLQALLDQGVIVEIGQRRKRLVRTDRLRLVDPQPAPWFETYSETGQAIPLFGMIGGFSQPGFAVNRLLVGEVARQAQASGARQVSEIFCGSGNFTLALAHSGYNCFAIENDELSLLSLRRSLEHKAPETPPELQLADAYRLKDAQWLERTELLLVDPPRSGLRNLLDLLEANPTRPQNFIYVSCFSETLLADAARLKNLGYTLQELTAVNQFPLTTHCEWVARFSR